MPREIYLLSNSVIKFPDGGGFYYWVLLKYDVDDWVKAATEA